MTPGAIAKIDYLIEESAAPNLLDLGTNAKRLLAAKIHDLTEKERDQLGLISKRLKVGIKNGAIDGTLAAIIFGLVAGTTSGSAPVAAIAAAIGGAASAAASWKKNRKDAYTASDMNRVMGSKEIDKLVKELEGLIGKPLVKLIKLEGKIRLK